MAVNDLAESSFASMTVQLQIFGLIGMASAAAICDMDRKGFLDQPTTNKDMIDKKTSLFYDFSEEFQITAIMCAVQEAPAKRESNISDLDRQRNTKQDSDNMVNMEVLKKAENECIQCLI